MGPIYSCRDGSIGNLEGFAMQDIRVGVIQMNALLGEVDQNLTAHVDWTRKAAAKGAALICFPELSVTGHYCAGEVWTHSEPVPEGPSTQALILLAAELGVTISFGVAERDAGIAYNTQVIVGPSGYLGRQRKLHMSGDEYFHFRAGTQMPVIDIGACKLAIGICYDNLFPEVSRIAAIRGAEVYLMPHAARFGQWPEDRQARAAAVKRCKSIWARVYAARAYDNGMYVVLCNQAGQYSSSAPTASCSSSRAPGRSRTRWCSSTSRPMRSSPGARRRASLCRPGARSSMGHWRN